MGLTGGGFCNNISYQDVVLLNGSVGIASSVGLCLAQLYVVPIYEQAASTPPPRMLCSSMTATGMSVKLHHSMNNGEGVGAYENMAGWSKPCMMKAVP